MFRKSEVVTSLGTERQTDSLYFRTMIIKAMQLVGINTKPKNEMYRLHNKITKSNYLKVKIIKTMT